MIEIPPGLSAEHAREYRLFTRWCKGARLIYMPAAASTVVAYLAENPGVLGMQRNRVTAINAAHRHTLDPVTRQPYPEPGAGEAVRQALNQGRAERMASYRARVDELLPGLTVDGWPEGLFDRRDAVILLLAASGLSWRQIADLRQHDVHIDEYAVAIGPQPLVTLSATGGDVCPVSVFRRWIGLLSVAPPATGHVRLERILADGDEADPALRPEYGALPFIPGFDGRGWPLGLPGELEPLTASTIAAITAGHLTARIPVGEVGDLDPTYYERGVAARWRAKAIGDDLDALFERLDELADDVLEASRNSLRTCRNGFPNDQTIDHDSAVANSAKPNLK